MTCLVAANSTLHMAPHRELLTHGAYVVPRTGLRYLHDLKHTVRVSNIPSFATSQSSAKSIPLVFLSRVKYRGAELTIPTFTLQTPCLCEEDLVLRATG